MITCQYENGDKVSLRHVTVNAIIVRDGKILLGKRGTFHGQPILESGEWALLGGFFDRDENLIDAVQREVKEESGWEIASPTLLRINDNPNRPKEDRQNVDMIFFTNAVKQEHVVTEEVRELKWFDLDTLPEPEEFAFDHGEDVQLYLKYRKEKFTIPVIG